VAAFLTDEQYCIEMLMMMIGLLTPHLRRCILVSHSHVRVLQPESSMRTRGQERPVSLMRSVRHSLGTLGEASVACP